MDTSPLPPPRPSLNEYESSPAHKVGFAPHVQPQHYSKTTSGACLPVNHSKHSAHRRMRTAILNFLMTLYGESASRVSMWQQLLYSLLFDSHLILIAIPLPACSRAGQVSIVGSLDLQLQQMDDDDSPGKAAIHKSRVIMEVFKGC